MDDFRATNRPATALLADDEGFERASHNDHFAHLICLRRSSNGRKAKQSRQALVIYEMLTQHSNH
jgi:hypothetical protein